MTSIVTSKYRTDDAELFLNDVTSNDYYLFISTLDRNDVNNSEYYKNDFLEKTIFGKKINASNAFYMITNNRWQENTVYDQYDDRQDMTTKNFYVVIYPEIQGVGDYIVYKCLSNNYGTKSTVKPYHDDPLKPFLTGDGYTWKYMYKISNDEFEKYFVSGYIPVIQDNSANTTPDTAKTISSVIVDNDLTNQGYSYKTGKVAEILNSTTIKLNPSETGIKGFNPSTNYYLYYSIYISNVYTGKSAIYKINSYTYSSGAGIFTIENIDPASTYTITLGNDFKIFPQVLITGDGEGAIAIPTMDIIAGTLVNQDDIYRVSRIDLLKYGTNYTNAKAIVVDPTQEFNPTDANTNDERATLRVILSPKGGHGINPKEELLSRYILIYGKIENSDNLEFSTTNKYTRLGIVKNPEFILTSNNSVNEIINEIFDNRLEVDIGTNYLMPGDIVTQVNGTDIFFQAQVHETANNIVYLTDFNGPYQNSSNAIYTSNTYFTDFNIYDAIHEISTTYLNPINSDLSIDISFNLIAPSGQQLSINSIKRPTYIQKTGDVYYMSSFAPITRTADSHEEYKIILEF